jgi:hypothetical protein
MVRILAASPKQIATIMVVVCALETIYATLLGLLDKLIFIKGLMELRRESKKSTSDADRTVRPTLFDPMSIIRWAGLAVMALLFVGVGAGFRGESVSNQVARALLWLEPLAQPIILGLSAMELVGIIAVTIVLGLSLWRGARR